MFERNFPGREPGPYGGVVDRPGAAIVPKNS